MAINGSSKIVTTTDLWTKIRALNKKVAILEKALDVSVQMLIDEGYCPDDNCYCSDCSACSQRIKDDILYEAKIVVR